jgi:4-nitrophenyl phosphatase
MTIPFSSLRAVVLDMDGVLWRADQVLPGVAEFSTFVQQHQIAFALATNNSTKTVESYVDRLNRVGVPAQQEQVITSAVATADYVCQHYAVETPLYIVGETGLHETLAARGYHEDPARAEVVVMGMDRQLTYEKLKIATLRIRAGADFISTNGDRTFPVPEGLVPGNGSLVAAVQTATDVDPVMIGKPGEFMYDVALQRLGTTAQQTLMVGDRLETDILGALRAGLPSALVLTGVTSPDQAREDVVQADGIFADLLALVHAWQAALV